MTRLLGLIAALSMAACGSSEESCGTCGSGKTCKHGQCVVDGELLYEKTFGGSNDDTANSIQETTDGGYIMAGWTNSKNLGKQDAWVLKFK